MMSQIKVRNMQSTAFYRWSHATEICIKDQTISYLPQVFLGVHKLAIFLQFRQIYALWAIRKTSDYQRNIQNSVRKLYHIRLRLCRPLLHWAFTKIVTKENFSILISKALRNLTGAHESAVSHYLHKWKIGTLHEDIIR